MRVHQGRAGWHRLTECDFPGEVYVRVAEVDGSLKITELYADGRGRAIIPSWLRGLPLRLIEETAEWLEADGPHGSSNRTSGIGPDLSRLATWYGSTVSATAAGKNWVYDSFLAQARGSKVAQAPRARMSQSGAEPEEPALSAPGPEGLSDEFLVAVAEAYRRSVAKRLPPAKTLAALAGVSPRTVHDWVAKARKRGLMAPASTRGRVV